MNTIAFLTFVFLIVQQPVGHMTYVSKAEGVMTQLQIPHGACVNGDMDNVVLFAEESQEVASLIEGDRIILTGNGVYRYVITDVQRYRATNGASVHSTFIDQDTLIEYGSAELAQRIFCLEGNRLIIQTCFDGVNGRIFVIAEPMITTRWSSNEVSTHSQ